MYALDRISFPGFCGSYEEIHGWSQSHYLYFIVKHHVNHQSLSTLSMGPGSSWSIMASFNMLYVVDKYARDFCMYILLAG